MAALALTKYRVHLLADGVERIETIYAAGKRQAAVTASKTVHILTGAKVVQIKRVRVAS